MNKLFHSEMAHYSLALILADKGTIIYFGSLYFNIHTKHQWLADNCF